ncbi:MAG: DUF4340 domain-containing protein [Thiohalorhabdaceae bacterium]
MNVRTWLNIALALIVVALAGVAYLRPGKEPAEPKPALVKAGPSKVERLALQPAKGEIVQLAREKGRWRLTAPKPLPADGKAVKSVTDLLRAKSQGIVENADPKAAEYGLKEPEWTLQAGGHRIALGGKHPIERQRFVRVDDAVHRVKASALRGIKTDWTGYVSPRLVPPGADLTRVELPRVTLEKTKQGKWRAAGGSGLKASKAEATARMWRNRRAISIETFEGDTASAPSVTLHLATRQEPLRYAVKRGDKRIRLIRTDLGISYGLLAKQGQDLLWPQKSDQAKGQEGGKPGSG